MLNFTGVLIIHLIDSGRSHSTRTDSILRTATVSILPPLSRLATLTHQANDTKALQSGVTSDELSWAVRDMWARIDGSAQLPVLDPPSIPSPTTL